MMCPDCNGERRVEGERVIGGYSYGNPWQGYESCWIECETCFGTGEVEDEVVEGALWRVLATRTWVWVVATISAFKRAGSMVLFKATSRFMGR